MHIEARAPTEYIQSQAGGAAGRNSPLNVMLRPLLIDRFHIVVHYEEQLRETPALTAEKPRLSVSDPATRTKCSRETRDYITKVTCSNVTMAEENSAAPECWNHVEAWLLLALLAIGGTLVASIFIESLVSA